jgi:hypothetical protein
VHDRDKRLAAFYPDCVLISKADIDFLTNVLILSFKDEYLIFNFRFASLSSSFLVMRHFPGVGPSSPQKEDVG